MYLKREPPMSLPKPLLMKNFFSTRERPARTPPSTFLFLPIHFSNSPGIMAIPTLRLAGEPAKLVHPRTIGYRFTVPVRSFRGAQSRRKRTARRWVVYRRCPLALSTENGHFLGPHGGIRRPKKKCGRPIDKQCLNSLCAALRPYSCVVLGGLFEGRNRNGGLKPPSNQAS